MANWTTNRVRTYGKQIGTGALTSFVWGLVCIIYDFYNLNDWLFPFLKGWSLQAILTTSFVGTFLIVMTGVFVFAPNDTVVDKQERIN